MMENLAVLKEYFRNGDAQKEARILPDIFVAPEDYDEIIQPEENGMRILVGRKGSGKSAILNYIVQDSCSRGCNSIFMVPSDYVKKDFSEAKVPASIISELRNEMIAGIAAKIGEQIHLPIDQSEELLRQVAQASGDGNVSGFDYVVRTLNQIIKNKLGLDIHEIAEAGQPVPRRMERAINQYMEKESNRVFYVLLDDIDQIASARSENYFDIIWYEILAAAQLPLKLKNIFPIVSIRKEIWDKFSCDNGNRDKFDQIRMMQMDVEPDRETLRQILEKRLMVCNGNLQVPQDNVYAGFFEGRDCKMPFSEERRLWRDYLVSSSRSPRDLVQLVSELAQVAKKDKQERIGDREVEKVSHRFSEERVRDLLEQNKERFQHLEQLIQSFIYAEFCMSADELKKHLESQPDAQGLRIDGHRIRPGEDAVFPLWDLLNNIGFFNVRIKDRRKSKQYDFLPYSGNRVLAVNWNELQKYEWEIHPCYRVYLIDYQKQELNRIGSVKFQKKQQKHRL